MQKLLATGVDSSVLAVYAKFLSTRSVVADTL
jgi:hypothetical protein